MTVKLLTDLSAERVYYGDLQHIDKANHEIKIIGDGACPPSLAGKRGPGRFARARHPHRGRGGRAVGASWSASRARACWRGSGGTTGEFEMVLARCAVFEPPADELEERQLECGIPFWPHAFVTRALRHGRR